MTFREHVLSSGKSQSSWAADLSISRSYFSELLNGNRLPSLELASKIEVLTNGRVPAGSWHLGKDALSTVGVRRGSVA
jgi:transcriptional regulator with XRE-family HTH domain